MITDKQGNVYSAKTMEYAAMMPFVMSYVPAGTEVVSVAPGNKPGLSFETKFPVLGVSADVGVGNGINMMVESANNQGLSLSTNEMPGSQSPAGAGSEAAKALAATDLALYLLGNFQSVVEVKEALQGEDVSVWLPKVPICFSAAQLGRLERRPFAGAERVKLLRLGGAPADQQLARSSKRLPYPAAGATHNLAEPLLQGLASAAAASWERSLHSDDFI
jgi:hypothetical protein